MTVPPPLSEHEAERLRALRNLNLVETPLEERFERITRLAKSALRVDIVALSLVEANRQYFKSIQGLDVCETPRDVSFCGHTILQDDMMIVRDARQDELFKDNPLVTGPPHIVTYAGVPLYSSGGYKVGTLCAIHKSVHSFGTTCQQQLRDTAVLAQAELESVASNAVQAMLTEEVAAERRRALIDPLTRLWNREGILEYAAEAIADAQKRDSGVAMLYIDLNQFKQVNDTCGHAAGDAVLREVGRHILSALRESDGVGRLGGDEFLCVLTQCESEEQARAVAQRIRERVAEHPTCTSEGELDIDVSIGMHFEPRPTPAALSKLIERADADMYRVKRCKPSKRDAA